MDIEFVNHASVILRSGGFHLLSDPWFEGTAFNQSWALLAPTRFRPEDFKTVTHLWFSHEHPDHFSPATVRQIPSEARRHITVLYRTTADRKVVNYCRQLGFQAVRELPSRQWVELTPEAAVLCAPAHDDSVLAVRAEGQTVLNTNDAVLDAASAEAVRRLVGPVDVLLTQFSYANYVGETFAARRQHAERKYREMGLQSRAFTPRFLIPFASYVWFCHEENAHMNDAVNRVGDVYRHFLARGAPTPIVLSPSETWEIGSPHDSAASAQTWEDHYRRVASATLVASAPRDWATLETLAKGYAARLNRLAYIGLFRRLGLVTPLTIWVTDHSRAVSLGLEGFHEGPWERNADVAMSSDTLAFCLQFDYGFGTTAVSGRFSVLSPEGPTRMGRFQSLGNALNHGRIDMPALVKGLIRRALRRARRRLRRDPER